MPPARGSGSLVLCLAFVAIWSANASNETGNVDLSGFKCNQDNWWFMVCHFTNVTLWRGQLYYISTNASLELPEARLCERRFEPKVKDVIKVVTPKALQADVLSQASLSQAVRHERALLFTPWVLPNYWHSTDDTAQLFLRFCHHMGICTYSPSAVHSAALLAYQNGDWTESFPLGVRQLFGCFASTMYQVAPSPSNRFHAFSLPQMGTTMVPGPGDDRAGDEVPLVHFNSVMVGVGKRMIPLYGPQYGLQDAPPQDKIRRIKYMRMCAGLTPLPEHPSPRRSQRLPPPPQQHEQGNGEQGKGGQQGAQQGEVQPVRRVRPHVVLVNRRYTAGRSILRLDEVYFVLRQRHVSASLAFLEGASLAAQARIFASADVLVVPHGAATGNFYFLPKHAVILQVSNFVVHKNHDSAVSRGLPPPWYDITFNSIFSEDDVDFVEPIMFKVRRNAGFRQVPPAWQAATLLNGTNLAVYNEANFAGNDLGYAASQFPEMWANPHDATFYLNFHVPPEWLVGNVTSAMELWKKKANWKGPSLLGEWQQQAWQQQEAGASDGQEEQRSSRAAVPLPQHRRRQKPSAPAEWRRGQGEER